MEQLSVDGDYFINDANGTTILQMTAANADFGSSTTDNFCVTSLNIDDDASVQQINQPNGIRVQAQLIQKFKLLMNQPLTSVDINYQLSGNALLTYAWSGNLSSGQSTTITLPTLTLSWVHKLLLYTLLTQRKCRSKYNQRFAKKM